MYCHKYNQNANEVLLVSYWLICVYSDYAKNAFLQCLQISCKYLQYWSTFSKKSICKPRLIKLIDTFIQMVIKSHEFNWMT